MLNKNILKDFLNGQNFSLKAWTTGLQKKDPLSVLDGSDTTIEP